MKSTMRLPSCLLFILFNIYLIESADRTESEKNVERAFESEKSEFVPGGARERSDDREEEILYEEYEYDDGRENSISGKREKPEGNSTGDSLEGFPNEVFLSLRNITADAGTALRSFTNRNDVVDLQASASDNLNVTVNNTTFGDAESAGINLRALRDAGHPPLIIDHVGGEPVHLPFKHTKIDTADLSDCALQGEWKPMGVAHGQVQVAGEHPNTVEVLQSVGSYAVPNRVIPLWQQQNHVLSGGGVQDLQDGAYKPSGLYGSGAGGSSYGSGFGYASGSGLHTNGGGVYGGGAYGGSGLGQPHKIKSASMLSPPPIPPIIFGKKPGYWLKQGKTKHKLVPGKGRRPGGSYGFPSEVNHAGFGHAGGYLGGAGGGGSGHLSHVVGGGGVKGGAGVVSVYAGGGGGGVRGHGLGGGGGVGLSMLGYGGGGGAVAEHLIAEPGVLSGNSESGVGVDEGVSGHGYVGGGQVSGSGVGSLGGDGSSGLSGGHLVSVGHGGVGGESLRGEVALGQYADSSFSSTHVSQGVGGGNSVPDAAFLSGHISQDFGVDGQGVSDDLSSSSTFTCGKNHDHNTNYHTATFQVADHEHPSSVDVLQYGGDAAVLIQSGDASFHDQVLPERKHYKTSHLSDAEVSGSDNRNELSSQTAKLTGNPSEEVEQLEAEPDVKADDGEEPERHSYYREITKVTKIPATSVGSVQYTFSQYETKPQTFSTESDAIQDEPDPEPPQIIRELEHLSNKFQLDLENPQKLFEDPPSQELAYHYPFQDTHHHQQDKANLDPPKDDEAHQGITEFPYQFYHDNANKLPLHPAIYNKPLPKYTPRPGKPHFYQKTTVNYLQPRPPPLVVIRKSKPKHFLKKKQNYEVREHGGERHRPLGEIFPPQKSPKQFHNPKPNFAVERPKNGWRGEVQEYKYDHSHGKKVRKFNTKAKVIAPVLIRRPVSPGPVIRVVEVAG